MGEVAFRPTFYQINRGVIDEMAPRYFSIINRDRYFVFTAATAENKVTNGSKTFIALFDKLCTN